MNKHKRARLIELDEQFWALTTWQERLRFIILLQNKDVSLLCNDSRVCKYIVDLSFRAHEDKVFGKEVKEVSDQASREFQPK